VDRTATNEIQQPIPSTAVPKIGAILHELFKNTDEWAKSDSDFVPWRRSVRGLAVERHSWAEADLQTIKDDTPALRLYLDACSKIEAKARHRFLELSVFDSGVGLARQWLQSQWSPQIPIGDEYLACLACLTKHRTSSAKSEKGLGLAEVMATVGALNGFLKVRSGRLSLYRDFVSAPLQSSTDVTLQDFPSCSPSLSELGAVFGTHYQILIPVP